MDWVQEKALHHSDEKLDESVSVGRR